jgi:hypothetical protein
MTGFAFLFCVCIWIWRGVLGEWVAIGIGICSVVLRAIDPNRIFCGYLLY